MDPATLYLIYVAATGGPERKVVEHFDSRIECEAKIVRWQDGSQNGRRYKVSHAACLTPKEYNTMVGVFSADTLDPKYRP
jgi:hypothetical protein